ncbi:uncharacterized protein LOC116207691 [Punica granatum]|uniref:Uncharacterized protein LOC116207691 n=1 Tax=Punica granatum TaxID=22663 RepID=A0A6P8DQG9_PUNGR|nr:uncharacterized protein LOC116207691 [Punica granatum]
MLRSPLDHSFLRMTASLQFPCHEHPLIPRELSVNCTVHCNRCAHPILGSTRCCLECELFFHEWCTEWPLQIQHPSHPQHSLTLITDNCFSSNYCCHECCFSASAEDLVSTLPPLDEQAEERETINHFAHEHPLTSFSVTTPNNIRCGACKKEISGRVYGCRSCMLLLHESCAQLPQEILQHPFHSKHHLTLLADSQKQFKCNACGLPHEFAYHCDECRFNLDVLCAVSTLSLQDQHNEDSVMIDHFSHPHQLKSFSIEEDSNHITCKACELNLSGEIYGCLNCIFFLHKSCTELHQDLVHALHPNHFLILREKFGQSDGKFRCSCCSETSTGFVYNCEMCDFNLDIECALETLSILEAGAMEELQHFAHDHLLSLCYRKDYNGPNCNACKQPVHGLCYCCLSCESFVLHQSYCHTATELKHPFHPQHPLTPLPRPLEKRYFYCSACNRKSMGFTFYCAECDFYLDIRCANAKPTLRHQLHEHDLAYFERATSLHCNACGNSCNTDLYRCAPCNFNLHYDCLPLPPIIQHDFYHPYHPLTLCEKYVDERLDEQYCDACEETRNPDHGVYFCEPCCFAAHIACVIPVAEPEGRKAIENTKLNILDKEIASLKAEIERRAIKLERLLRESADKDSRFKDQFEEGSVHETSKTEIETEETKLTELKKLDEEIASLDAPIKQLKENIEAMKQNLEALENKQLGLMRKRGSMTS